MEGTYTLTFGSREVGQVRVTREGLYYRFFCTCQLSGDVISRVFVTCGGKSESLGVLVPREGSFVLGTRLPVKRLGEGEPVFTVMPNRPERAETFIPIKPEEPFTYLERLKDAYLARQNGEVGIVLREKGE